MERWGRTIAPSSTLTSTKSQPCEETNAVLRELVELLEDYAPIWYTEELHARAASALGHLQPAI